MSPIHVCMSLLIVIALAGCGSAAPQADKSAAGIRSAEELGAAKMPRAALYLQLAKEEAAKSKAMAAAGEPEQARSMMMRSETDADMAVVVARAETQRAKAVAADERVRQLKQGNK